MPRHHLPQSHAASPYPRFLSRRRFARRPLSLPPPTARRIIVFLAMLALVITLLLLPGFRISSSPTPFLSTTNFPYDSRRPAAAGDNSTAIPEHPIPVAVPHPPTDSPALVPSGSSPPISAIVLFHNEYDTLNHTLLSWEANLLPSHLSEILFFLNGVPTAEEFHERLPVLRSPPWQGMIRVVASPENLKLGLAINRMVQLATEDTVLLLEKDWALIEPSEVVGRSLASAARLVREGEAHVVRFRHRERPGAPLHARIMHENREKQMLSQQTNLYCYAHHWVKNPVEKYPDFFSKCSNREEDEETWCAKAKYCQWTNNPALFNKAWFLTELGDKYVKLYNETINTDPNSGMLDFEFFTNWKAEVWNDRDFVVALPKGLFEHQEVGEQTVQNTVWYGWMRLNTDVEEKRTQLFDSESTQCAKKVKNFESGPKFVDKYPVEFARLYHYDRAMNRTVDEAVEELQEVSTKMREQLERGEGTWRNGITALTDLYYKTILFAYPTEPEDMDIAFVTSLYNAESEEEPGDADLDIFCGNVNFLRNYKKVIYCTAETKSRVEAKLKERYSWGSEELGLTNFSAKPVQDATDSFLGKENVERVNKLHGQEQWASVVRERGDMAPSANSLVMSMAIPYMLRAALDLSPATHFVWFSALSRCMTPDSSIPPLTTENDTVLRGNLLLSAFLTGVYVTTPEERNVALEGSGFPDKNLKTEMEIKDSDRFRLVDFKTLGGTRLGVALMTAYYDVTLRDMLRRGHLGTGREAMSIARQNVEYHFRFFDSASSCRSGDGNCTNEPLVKDYMKDRAGLGCSLWRWTRSCSVGEG